MKKHSSGDARDDAREVDALRVSWDSVLLVCRQCAKRSSGPADLKTKSVVKALRSGAKASKPMPRVVQTSCLGPCPKRAMTVASIGPGRQTQVWAVRSESEALAVGSMAIGKAGDKLPKPAPTPLEADVATHDASSSKPDVSSEPWEQV